MNLFSKKPGNLFVQTQQFLNSVEYINYGGCGIAALALYDAAVLEGRKPKIVYLYHPYHEADSRTINEGIMKGEIEPTKATSCYHICVQIGKKIYHADGEFTKDHEAGYLLDFPKQYVTKELLLNSLKYAGWNSQFDRKKWVPKIKEMLKLEVEIPTQHVGGGRYI